MKHRPNQKRRTGRGFNGVDKETGYAVRFEQAKDGGWSAKPVAFMALSGAWSLRTVRRLTNEAIHICLEDAKDNGYPVPEPEGRATCLQ